MNAAAIAIVGMAGRFPGARNTSAFWRNLRDGIESIRDLSESELQAAGATEQELADPNYVRRAAVLDDVPMFDASFFGMSPRDASIMDPQHRHFLECAWEAFEDAAHPPQSFSGAIGVFAGSGMNAYLIHNLLLNRRLLESAGMFQLKQTGNDKDVLATRVSYQFDLRGPSVNVQTACSTSLVAVHLACQSLLNFECDMALAGGVTIEIPHGLGYVYREGEILSRDGHCRAFDAASSGTVFGSGMGIVVLRRLQDALADHDHIRAVILGSAINNDGARKVGYLAPSVEGQAEVIAEALEFAGVSADDISYIETHGTGTLVGDPIEVRALKQAFRKSTGRSGFCRIGSLKTNIGHLDAAAGVASLIKTVLALENAQLPPSLNFKTPNPHLELADSPFIVNDTLTAWPSNRAPRRAGVTSLGIGGTNAHIVLEEPPALPIARHSRPYQLLLVSAKSDAAADRAWTNLANHLRENREVHLADVAFTSQLGRRAFAHRRAIVVEDQPESIDAIAAQGKSRILSGVAPSASPSVAFMFSGQGSQYVPMGRDLYRYEPAFREALNHCAELLQPHLGMDLLAALYPAEELKDAASKRLDETWLTQPALFSVEYALARWWMSLGVKPAAMVGHSIGEYVAACLAGVFSLEDALAMVSLRGRLIFGLPTGSMLAVALAAEELALEDGLSVAAINAPHLCVISGPADKVAGLEQRLAQQSIVCRRLHTSHAFHSGMMDPILAKFEQRLRSFTFHPPTIPYLSNVSGTWIKAEEATDPGYWARHIRSTVRFSACLDELLRIPERILLEAGPGNALVSLARQHVQTSIKALQSLPHPREAVSDLHCAYQSLGQLWTSGVEIDFSEMHPAGSAKRVSLPTYSFERQRHWIEPDRKLPEPIVSTVPASKAPEVIDTWFYRRTWKLAQIAAPSSLQSVCTVVFRDSLGIADAVISRLRAAGNEVITVDHGSHFKRSGRRRYQLRARERADYDALIAQTIQDGLAPRRFLHFWSVCPDNVTTPLDRALADSFYSPLFLAQALAAHDESDVEVVLVSSRLQRVAQEAMHHPERAVLLGPARVIDKELPGIHCRAIDIDPEDGIPICADQLIAEIGSPKDDGLVAYRGSERFIETVERFNLEDEPSRPRLKQYGVYLITGGLGGIGQVVAEHLAREFKARLILVSRSELLPESDWEEALNRDDVAQETKILLRKLVDIRSAASDLVVLQGDVRDPNRMREIVALAHERFGTIDGVFHAAGVLDDRPLLAKTAESMARVLDPKVRGTLVLEEALRYETLSCFVLFSSISSLFPPAGQVDYAAANAFLDAFAQCHSALVTAIDWGAWREVGMAARVELRLPLLEQRLLETPRQIVFSAEPSRERQWVLDEHRWKSGDALIPGTAYLEMAAEALSGASFAGPLEFRDVLFLAPLLFAPSESKEVRVQLRVNGQAGDGFAFSVLARDPQWVEYATGQVARCMTGPAEPVDRKQIESRCCRREILFDDSHRTRQEQYFNFGPRWRCLTKLNIGNREALAEIDLPESCAADLNRFRIHPALLDMATGCSLYLIDGYEASGDLYLPFAYKRLRLFRSIPEKFVSHVRLSREVAIQDEIVRFDVSLFNDEDRLIAEIEGFALRRIANPGSAENAEARMLEFASGNRARTAEIPEHFQIDPAAGVRALDRALSCNAPTPLIVAAEPIEDFAPPVRSTPTGIKAPERADQSIEETLCAWFQDLLGIEKVGPDEDFFALGGHSLIGVRLFAKIKNHYDVELELATLFAARTPRALGQVIRKSLEPTREIESVYPYLVPIQPHGSQIPLFLIHAIGGEVLFYEPLARALGSDQPVYALQSYLTNRPSIEETSIEELASVYVKEIRTFFPQGPYLIGGHSYGGLVALEMARQLDTQGIPPQLLLMLDAVVPGSTHHVGRSTQLATLLANVRKGGFTYLLRKAGIKRAYLKKQWAHRTQIAACSLLNRAGRSLPAKLRYALIEEMHLRAMNRYVFKPYPGRITLIRAVERGFDGVESLSEHDDALLGWGRLAESGVEVHDVPGHHVTMLLDPTVRAVAKKIKAVVSQLGIKSDSSQAAVLSASRA